MQTDWLLCRVAASGRHSEAPISDVPMVGKVMQYATPANFAGLPAISVPVGMDSNGALAWLAINTLFQKAPKGLFCCA